MTTAAATALFTPSADFVITAINTYGVFLTGTIAGASVNFGWTATAYDDFATGLVFLLQTQGAYANYTAQSGLGINEHLIIPASTPFFINVTSPDATATTNTQRIDILGYYL